MKISTKMRYGLRTLIYIGAHGVDRNVQVREISQSEDISPKYLEQIIQLLKGVDFLQVTRGAKGGYRLLKDPKTITLKEVYNLLEGTTNPVECLESDCCSRRNCCLTYKVWDGMAMAIDSYLESITLGELINEYKSKQQAIMFYI